MNALSGDTYLFAEIDGKYGVYTLKELYELHKQGQKIKVPTLIDERGNIDWVEVEDVVSFGKQRLKRITLATTRLYAELYEDAIISAFGSDLFSGKEEKIILKFKHVNELKNIQDPRCNSSLLLTTRIPLNIPEGTQNDWELGFALGFWVAEGNFHKRKRKNTKQSLAKLNWHAKQKGMTLEEYLEYMTDVAEVFLTVGENDFERKYIDILQKHFKLLKPLKVSKNGYLLCSTDLNYIHLIMKYTEGHTSHDKHVKNEVYNYSWKMLEGILDGFLSGDGNYVKMYDLFQIQITTNNLLYNDLVFLSKSLGYDVHLRKAVYAMGGFANSKFYWSLKLGIFKTYHRRSALGLVKEHIKSVEDAGEQEAYNLVLKPIYSENNKRAIFNHLFITAFGFLLSDAVKVLDRSVLSSSLPVPLSS